MLSVQKWHGGLFGDLRRGGLTDRDEGSLLALGDMGGLSLLRPLGAGPSKRKRPSSGKEGCCAASCAQTNEAISS